MFEFLNSNLLIPSVLWIDQIFDICPHAYNLIVLIWDWKIIAIQATVNYLRFISSVNNETLRDLHAKEGEHPETSWQMKIYNWKKNYALKTNQTNFF